MSALAWLIWFEAAFVSWRWMTGVTMTAHPFAATGDRLTFRRRLMGEW